LTQGPPSKAQIYSKLHNMDDQQQFRIYFGDILLRRLEITPAVLVAAMGNEEAGPEFLNMFLERCHGDPPLSDSVLKSAIDKYFFSDDEHGLKILEYVEEMLAVSRLPITASLILHVCTLADI
jgi:hypothetical protein